MVAENTTALPAMRGRIVTLQRFEAAHITPAYLAWLNDGAVMRYSNQRFRAHTEQSSRGYLSTFDASDNLFLAVYAGGDFIGTMTAYVSRAHQTADMGLLIGGAVQGQGLGFDAWVTLMDYLFAQGMRKVTGGTLRCNLPMVAIMRKAGMAPDGVRVAHELVNGVPEDILHFAKFAP